MKRNAEIGLFTKPSILMPPGGGGRRRGVMVMDQAAGESELILAGPGPAVQLGLEDRLEDPAVHRAGLESERLSDPHP
jgi:hypothetical protein